MKNLARTLAAGLVASLVLLACGDDTASSGDFDQPNVDIRTSDDPGELTDDEFDRITIDGMPCIVWKDERNSGANSAIAYSGLTCDWSPR